MSKESWEKQRMVRRPWKTSSLLGCDDEEKPQIGIERLQNISAPEELDGKRDTSTYWTLIGQGEHQETANISAPEELEWESEKRHKYLLNL
jgi:hypothetical protein